MRNATVSTETKKEAERMPQPIIRGSSIDSLGSKGAASKNEQSTSKPDESEEGEHLMRTTMKNSAQL